MANSGHDRDWREYAGKSWDDKELRSIGREQLQQYANGENGAIRILTREGGENGPAGPRKFNGG